MIGAINMLDVLERIYTFLSSPTTLFCTAIVIIAIYTLSTATNFLNIKRVFSDYYKIFSGAKTHLLIFWGVPILFSLALIQVALISGTISENILVFLSILIAAFFSMLSILVSQQANINTSTQFKIVLKESASLVLLEIILCIFALIITLAASILGSTIDDWLSIAISFADYYVIFVMLLNTLILIKRIKALIDNTN